MNTVLRAAIGYVFLLAAVRLLGRRTISQLAPLDFVVLFLFAGTTITAILSDDRSLVGGVSAVFTIGLLHIGVSELKFRFAWFGRLVDGTPIIVFEKGRWHQERMRRLRIQEQDVMMAVRQRGLQRLDQIRYAIIERDGRVSIVEDEK